MHINAIIPHRSTTSQTNMGMITTQFSRSHGQPLQRPQEVQQMLKIFVCQSLVFHKHDAMSDKHANSVTTLHHVTNTQLSSQSYSAPPDLHTWCQDIQQSSAQLSNRRPLVVRSTANIPRICHFAKLHDRSVGQGILEPFTTPGHSTATQLLQPNFHAIGRRGWRGRMLHSHRHSLQQMKQRPQNCTVQWFP